MKKILLAGAACLVLASPVLAQSMGEKTGVNSAIGISPSTADFVKMAAISDMFEIELSKLAQQRADSSSKTFAAKMIEDHTKTTSELKELVSSGKVKAELPTEMDSAHKSKLEKLQSLNGADFDKQYDSDQVSAHKDAVSMFQRYASGGDNESLKAFASKTLPHLQGHLQSAQQLKTESAPTVGQGSDRK
jgi:putative membrane protein